MATNVFAEPGPNATASAHPQGHATWATIMPAGEAVRLLDAEWVALGADAAEPNAFAEHWFASAAIRHLEGADEVRIAGVWTGTAGAAMLIGAIPLSIEPHYGRLPVAHVENWRHAQTFLGTPLVRAGHESAFWSALLTALDGAAWAPAFLHIDSLVEDGPVHRGLAAAARAMGRRCDIVHRSERAMLASDLSPEAYYETTVRKKKRKEIKRLQARLAELGTIRTHSLASAGQVESWCNQFLSLERAGWKGEAGSALGCMPATEGFFREAVAKAFAAERLNFLRMDLNERPIAMLVNFMTPPGGFSFKIAFDEDYARFSPGVLIEIENLAVLARGDIAWMDSCAVENHPMINTLWSARRPLVRLTVPLAGFRRAAAFRICRMAEDASAALRRLTARPNVTRPIDE